MDQLRAVPGVFAVITGVMMAAGNIHRPGGHEWIELCRLVGEQRRDLPRIIGIGGDPVARDDVPGAAERRLRTGHSGWRSMAGIVDKARVRERIACATTLFIQSEFVGTRERRRDA